MTSIKNQRESHHLELILGRHFCFYRVWFTNGSTDELLNTERNEDDVRIYYKDMKCGVIRGIEVFIRKRTPISGYLYIVNPRCMSRVPTWESIDRSEIFVLFRSIYIFVLCFPHSGVHGPFSFSLFFNSSHFRLNNYLNLLSKKFYKQKSHQNPSV